VIGEYNKQTIIIQVAILIYLIVAIIISYRGKTKWLAKGALGITNLFIGIVFFGIYGTEPIQKFFALPLYLLCGVLFLYECIHNKEDVLCKPTYWQSFLLFLFIMYPVLSIILGNEFPQMVTYIMPCPIVSLSIAVYSGYKKKNVLLLVLLTIWGLTGIKSLIFNAYEDLILLLCGFYGVILIVQELKRAKKD
jgi:hypothetical protein